MTPKVGLDEFVSCRLAEAAEQVLLSLPYRRGTGPAGEPLPSTPRPPADATTGRAALQALADISRSRRLLQAHQRAGHLTRRWAELEVEVRAIARRHRDHPDFDERWLLPRRRSVPAEETPPPTETDRTP